MPPYVVVLLLSLVALAVWRLVASYPVTRFLEERLVIGRQSPRILGPRRLVQACVTAALGARAIRPDGVATLPARIMVAVAPMDVARSRRGASGLSSEVTSAVIRYARRNPIRVDPGTHVVIVSDGHTIEGRPELLPTGATLAVSEEEGVMVREPGDACLEDPASSRSGDRLAGAPYVRTAPMQAPSIAGLTRPAHLTRPYQIVELIA